MGVEVLRKPLKASSGSHSRHKREQKNNTLLLKT